MTRSHMGALLALLTIALSPRIAAAQAPPTTAPAGSPAPEASPAVVPSAPPAAVPGASPGANPAESPGAVPAASPAAVPGATPAAGSRWGALRGPEAFVVGDYLWGTFARNEFNLLGENGRQSFAGRAAVSFPFQKLNVMVEGNYDHFQFLHQTSLVQPIGGGPALIVPTFFAHQTDWDGRIGVGIPFPRVHLVASFAQRRNSFGNPNLQGFGFGIEKLPDFDHKNASFFGSYLWYPQFGSGGFVQYGLYKYSFGIELHARRIPVFLEFGVIGDYAYAKRNAPTYLSDSGVISGIGFHF